MLERAEDQISITRKTVNLKKKMVETEAKINQEKHRVYLDYLVYDNNDCYYHNIQLNDYLTHLPTKGQSLSSQAISSFTKLRVLLP